MRSRPHPHRRPRAIPRPAAAVASTLALAAMLSLGACGAAESGGADAEAVADVTEGQDLGHARGEHQPKLTVSTLGTLTGPRVQLEAKAEGLDEVEVRVLVRDIPDLYGIAAHLRWDDAALELISHKGHTMMIDTDMRSRTLVKPSGDGRLLLGAARYRDGGSPWAGLVGAKVTNQIWATLRFRVLSSGKHTLEFDPDHTLAKASTYEDLALSWTSVEVVRTVATGGK